MKHDTDSRCRLWTIQPPEVLEELQRVGTLSADPTKGSEEDLFDAYAWMRRQMAVRVPGYGGGDVWWAYLDKPDLRHWRWRFYPGEWLRIELAIPRNEALLSDYDAWWCVMACHYYSQNDEEAEAWDSRLAGRKVSERTLPPDLLAEMETSWERIFNPGEIGFYASGEWQATFEHLRLFDVRRVTRFRTTLYQQYYGANPIRRQSLPPLTGHGDPIRIGDRVSITNIDINGGRQSMGTHVVKGYRRERGTHKLFTLDESGRPAQLCTGYRPYWRLEFEVLSEGDECESSTNR